MNELILKLNHIIFRKYYSRVDPHFKQWTFFKSVSLLRQNYEHLNMMYKESQKLLSQDSKTIDTLRSDLSNIRMGQLASDKTITQLNKVFGTKYTKPNDN